MRLGPLSPAEAGLEAWAGLGQKEPKSTDQLLGLGGVVLVSPFRQKTIFYPSVNHSDKWH